jgi:hypothetical protein
MRRPQGAALTANPIRETLERMTKKFMTFKHWQTGEIKTIEFRDADIPANPSSERLVVWNETEQKLEDVIKSTIVEIREE